MKNTLFTRDNLFVLNGLNSETVDLIYLDPPFNSKRTYSAPIGTKSAGASFKDMWSWEDVNQQYLESLIQDYPLLVEFIKTIQGSHGKPMMAYVTYMTQRVIQMHRVLKDTGSIYLHCDSTASHYLKQLMDFIFGRDNFRNEIIWQRNNGRGKGSQYKSKKFGSNTDTILFYTKSDDFYFKQTTPIGEKQVNIKFNKVDKNGGRYYTGIPIFCSKSMGARPNLCYEWRGFVNPYASGWRLSKERLEEEYQKGNVVIREDGKLERRKYLDDYEGEPLDNNWIDIPRLSGREEEATGYPTQKPLALLNRIIEASSKEGDVVLDPFCGCATACVAAQQSGRKWIGIDIEEQAADVLVERLTGDKGMFSDFIHKNVAPQRTDVERISIHEKSVKERLFKEQKGHCNGCNVKLDIWHFEVDHIIPRSKDGGDYYENYQLLCSSCNKIKGDRPMEYLRLKIETRRQLMQNKITFGE